MSRERKIVKILLSEVERLIQRHREGHHLESRIFLDSQKFRKHLQDFDIIINYKFPRFLRRSPFSRFIVTETHSYATHTGIYYQGKIVNSRMTKNALVREPISDRKDGILLFLRPRLTIKQKRQLHTLITQTLRQRKIKFDFSGIIGFFIYEMLRLKHNPLNARNQYFCSEATAALYYPVCRLISKDPATVSPKDILESKKLTFIGALDGVSNGHPNHKTHDDLKFMQRQLLIIQDKLKR
ncbi:MAG: hypothetical protein WC916_00990 [Candidatus Woesearchaeota archaeon]